MFRLTKKQFGTRLSHMGYLLFLVSKDLKKAENAFNEYDDQVCEMEGTIRRLRQEVSKLKETLRTKEAAPGSHEMFNKALRRGDNALVKVDELQAELDKLKKCGAHDADK